jgi:hypothetical protein
MIELQRDRLRVSVFPDRASMGMAAADYVAERLPWPKPPAPCTSTGAGRARVGCRGGHRARPQATPGPDGGPSGGRPGDCRGLVRAGRQSLRRRHVPRPRCRGVCGSRRGSGNRAGPRRPVRVRISGLGFGPFTHVGVQGELFAALGQRIRAALGDGTTCIAALCDGTVGYIPTADAFEQGGYEPNASVLRTGEGERLAAAVIDLIQRAGRVAPADDYGRLSGGAG